MNQNLKTLLFGILLCIISCGLMLIFDYLLFIKFADWTFPLTKKYLIINLTLIDMILVRFFPIVIALIHISFRNKTTKEYFKNVFWAFILIIAMIFLGLIIALLTWTHNEAKNPLLPGYLKDQPFDYYWTIFIVSGLLGLILYKYLKISKTIPIIFDKEK